MVYRYKKKKINGKKILLHRYIIEQHLNKTLKYNEIVHHIDGNVRNNNIKNLQIMTNETHNKLHGIKKSKKIVCICPICHTKILVKKTLYKYRKKIGQKNFYCSSKCVGKANGKIANKELCRIIKKEYKKLSGYMIAKKHNLNKKTVYNNIKKMGL